MKKIQFGKLLLMMLFLFVLFVVFILCRAYFRQSKRIDLTAHLLLNEYGLDNAVSDIEIVNYDKRRGSYSFVAKFKVTNYSVFRSFPVQKLFNIIKSHELKKYEITDKEVINLMTKENYKVLGYEYADSISPPHGINESPLNEIDHFFMSRICLRQRNTVLNKVDILFDKTSGFVIASRCKDLVDAKGNSFKIPVYDIKK